MNSVIERVREKFPQYVNVSDEDLTLKIGEKYPAYLAVPEFKTDFDNATRKARRPQLVQELYALNRERIANDIRYKQEFPDQTEEGGLLEQIGLGISSGFASLGQRMNKLLELGARVVPESAVMPGVKEGLVEQFRGASEIAGEAARDVEQLGRQTGGPAFARHVSGGVVSTVPTMVAAPVGIAGAALVAGVDSFAGTYAQAEQSYLQQGLTPEQARQKALAPALASGLVTGLVTRGFGATGLENWTRAVRSGSVRQTLGHLLHEVGMEATEEFYDQVGQRVIEELTFSPSATFAQAVQRTLEEAAQAGAAGGVAAGGLHIVSAARGGEVGGRRLEVGSLSPPAPAPQPATPTVLPPTSNLRPAPPAPLPGVPINAPRTATIIRGDGQTVMLEIPVGQDPASVAQALQRQYPDAQSITINETIPGTEAVSPAPPGAPSPVTTAPASPAGAASPVTTQKGVTDATTQGQQPTNIPAQPEGGDRGGQAAPPGPGDRVQPTAPIPPEAGAAPAPLVRPDIAADQFKDIIKNPTELEADLRKDGWNVTPVKPAKPPEPAGEQPAEEVTAAGAAVIGGLLPGATPTDAGVEVADWVRKQLETPTGTINSKDLFAVADVAFGGTQAQGKYTPKDAYDAVELGVNEYIRQLLDKFDPKADAPSAADIVQLLKDLVARLPTQTKRTAEQDEFQQFSTPPALAYVVNWVANLQPNEMVLEPSAGMGGLAVFAMGDGRQVAANELSPRRRGLLARLMRGMRIPVFEENAEQLDRILPEYIKPTVVVMNPPFSSTAGRMQGTRSTKNAIAHIQQALDRLQPGGRLVAIVGEGMALDKPTFKSWWERIKKKYNVRANVGIAGEEYAKYGTTFDNQIFIIDKTGPTTDVPIAGKVEKIADLIPLLERVRNERYLSPNQPAQPTPGQPPQPGVAPEAEAAAGPEQPVRVPTAGVEPPKRPGGTRPKIPGGAGGNAGAAGGGARPTSGAGLPPVIGPAGGEGGAGIPPGEGPGAGGGAAVGGTPQQAGGNAPGLSYGAASVGQQGEIDEAVVFEEYRPSVVVPGAKPHPTALAESAAMATVAAPAPNYQPNLPPEVVSQGLLSDAQLEIVIRAGEAHTRTLPNGERQGFFVGDGTGVGKGREISAVLLDNWRQGRTKHVWVSQTEDLLPDAKRDIAGIGWDPELVFPVSKTKPGDPLKAKNGIAFVSYDTMRVKKTGSRLEQLVNWLGKDFDGVIAFDEAHNMGNAVALKGARGTKDPSLKALAGVELQKLLPKARVVYVSATGATEVNNLSYATRLGLWGEGTPFAGVGSFVSQIAAGGVATMELVARDLKALGLYLARSLSFRGVTYGKIEHKLTPEQTAIYDELASAWQIVLQHIEDALDATGAKSNRNAKAAAKSQFWGAHQRFFNQVITSMQAPSVVAAVREDLAAGRSVIMQLVNTNEAATERQLAAQAAEGVTDLDELDLTPRESLMQYVQRSFPVQQYEDYIDANGNRASRPVKDSAGNFVQNPEAVAMRDALLTRLGSIRVPEGPLEIILNEFGTDIVGEVTGRKRRVVYGTDESGNRVRMIEKLNDAKRTADVEAFMGDRKQILIFSDKGGTGRSFHADLKAVNQRKRVHYLLQPGWRADRAVQGFGRSHRSNQKQPPHYVLVTTDLKAQKRFMSSIARRLDQLGALTKGQRQAGAQGMFSARDNLESREAADALEGFFVDLHAGAIEGLNVAEFERQTGLVLQDDKGNLRAQLPGITQFLNRLLSMQIELMNRVFDEWSARHDRVIQSKMDAGTLDVGLETLKALRIDVAREQTVYRHPASGAETKYVELHLTQPSLRLLWEQAKLQAKEGFVRNKSSGQILAVTHRGNRTASDGSIDVVFRLASPRATQQYVNQEHLEDTEKYEVIRDENQARAAWQSAEAAIPQTYTDKKHLITGLILPIWDRLKGMPRIVRAQTAAGRMLGRLINEAQLGETLHKLGAGMAQEKLPPGQVAEKILDDNFKATLSNGWFIKRSLVAGDERLELVGPDFTYQSEMDRKGVITERIQFKTRYFIPTGPQATGVLESIIGSNRPVVSLTAPVTRGAPPLPQTQDDKAADRVSNALPGMKINPKGGETTGESAFIRLQFIQDLVRVGVSVFNKGFTTIGPWTQRLVTQFGNAIKPWAARVWPQVQNAAAQQALQLSGQAMDQVNQIDAAGDEIAKPPEIRPVYGPGERPGAVRRVMGRPGKILYTLNPNLAQAKQAVDLREALAASAVRKASKDLYKQLIESAYNYKPGAWRLPRFLMMGQWARRLKRFQDIALPLAARLNAVAKQANGTFIFDDFEMRAGLMSLREFNQGQQQVGNVISVVNPLTGGAENLRIGNLITTSDGRTGYQLHRPMPAQLQQELYQFYDREYPDMRWLIDLYIDPTLKGVRQTIDGIEVPLFNRFSLEAMMRDRDPGFTGIAGYTPDVIATRSLLGAIKGVVQAFKRGRTSPGRKYKTGTSRESGNVRDLITGFNTRAFQVLQEQGRRDFFQAVLNASESKPGNGIIPEGYVDFDTGVAEVWNAIKRLRGWDLPTDPLTGQPLFPETEARLQGAANDKAFKAFIGEAFKLRGQRRMIRQEFVDLLLRDTVARRQHGKLYNTLAWLVRNSNQLFLAMPQTYVNNVLANELFTAEEVFRYTTAGLLKLGRGGRDLRVAANLFSGVFRQRFHGVFDAGYRRAVRTILPDEVFVLPDEVFADSTRLSDLKLQSGRTVVGNMLAGEIGSAALQLMRYGNVDIRPKQRLAYAILKANAETAAASAPNATAQQRATIVAQYMQDPPMQDRVAAIGAANDVYLNYKDSPQWLRQLRQWDFHPLLIQFPSFGYHYLAKQGQRLSALKLFLGKVPKGQRADALADLLSVATFGLGAGGFVVNQLVRALFGLDDDDAREYVGTSAVKYRDNDGIVRTKPLPRDVVTANRMNVSFLARALGIESDNEDDFWLRVRYFPQISMAGAALLAQNDAKKFGPAAGVETWIGNVTDLAGDFFNVGYLLRVTGQAYAAAKQEATGYPQMNPADAYATGVPFWFYFVAHTEDLLVPGARQFDDIVMMVDPVRRRETASKTLGYFPGPMEALRIGHITGLFDRILNDNTEQLPAAGHIQTVTADPTKLRTVQQEERYAEGISLLGNRNPNARVYYDQHGNPRIALVPAKQQQIQTVPLQLLRQAGVNVRPVNRRAYQEVLQSAE